MKKLVSLLVIAGMFFSCSEDDSDEVIITPPPPAGEANVVINEVAYLSGEVELINAGDAAMDVSEYFLCLGPGTYVQVGTIVSSGDTNLAPGAFLVLDYDMPNATGGLGLYRNNSDFTDPATLADFVQWGNAGSAREDVAVAAGIWTDGDFVPVVGSDSNSIVFDGDGNASSDWAETTTVTLGAANVTTAPVAEVRSVVINEVEYLINDEIELYNNGNVDVDLSNYWMCFGPGQYFRIGDTAMTTIVSGNVNLAPGEFLVITPATLEAPDDAGGLGLYANNDGFGNAANIRSFVQWGASGNARESVAVEAGIWNAGGFVPNVPSGASIAYDGEGFTSEDWEGTGTVTLGEANVFTEIAMPSVVINEVEYLINDEIELYNNGSIEVDLSNYWMCFGPGQYFRIGDAAMTTIVSGNVNLAPGEFLVISPATLEAPDDAGGLGLYANNDGFGNAANIRSFVQWGASGNVRESVAVEAGIWNAGGFVPNVPSGASIAYDGEGFKSEDWDGTGTVTLGEANVFTTPEVRSVVINEVEYLINDEIELYNNGNVDVDLSNYWMCFGPGQYFRIGDTAMTTIVSGNVNLAPGEFLVITPATLEAPDDAGGLGLYANNNGFGNAANIRSFVQWGASGNVRESVAVEAGIWNAGGFVPNVLSGNSIAYDGEGFTSEDWAGTGTVTLGEGNVFTDLVETRSVVINEVEYLINDEIELYNNGNVEVDLSNYWMCFGPGQYFRIGDAAMTTIVSGNVNLAPGEFLVITPATLQAPDDAGGLGLYANNNGFGNAANIRSFVQWGASGNVRESVAVEAGIWNAGGFVPNVASGSSIAYDGEGFSSNDWNEDTTPSLGSGNNQ